MYHRLLLSAALLSWCTGESLVNGPPVQVLTFVGEDVVLPCSFNVTLNNDFPTVEWSKEGLKPNVIFLYRDGCETYEMKNPAFHYRTSFITKEMKNRNISLRISNVQLSDAGKYQCMRLWKNAPREITTVDLVVGAVSEPKLSVVSSESGGVTLHCEASCWLLEPEIKFVDHQGNNIPADEPKTHRNTSGCFTVTRRVTLQDATHRVTCSVHQPEINQTRHAQIHIPASCTTSCSLTTSIAAVEAAVLLLLALSCGLTVLVKRKKSAKHQKLPRQASDQSTVSTEMAAYESQPFLTGVRVANQASDTVERLKREIADLKSKLHQKEERIRQLQNNKSESGPLVWLGHRPTDSTINNAPIPGNFPERQGLKPGNTRQNSYPVPDGINHRRQRIHSSPAALNFDDLATSLSSSARVSKKKSDHSMSDRHGQRGPKSSRQQRRHSMFTWSTIDNHGEHLAELLEESEPLVTEEHSSSAVNTKL